MKHFEEFYSYFRHFFLTILCFFFQVNCERMFDSVTYIWVTGGSEGSLIFNKFLMCCRANLSHRPPPPSLKKMGCWKFCAAILFTDKIDQF
jgi:hypothetical protein